MAGEFGYVGKILKVDLSQGNISELATSDYAERFLGGRGIAAKIYWDEVPPDTRPFDPENRLIFIRLTLQRCEREGESCSGIGGRSA